MRDLQSYLGRVERGFLKDVNEPYFPGEGLDTILAQWLDILRASLTDLVGLLNYEIDLSAKVGPMSYMKPLSDRLDDVSAYYEDIKVPQQPVDRRALDAVVREFGSGILRIRSQRNTIQEMKLSTSSGSPYFTKRRRVVDKTVPLEGAVLGDEVAQFLPDLDINAAAVLGWRGQEGGPTVEDVKQRVVWMFPFGINVLELQLYQSLISHIQSKKLIPAYVSNDLVDYRMTKLMDTKGEDELIVCTDFKRFDQHFGLECQKAAKYILSHMMQSSDLSQKWLESVFPIKYMIPLVLSDEMVLKGPHGMGSGSGGTNADESLLHRALQYEAAQRNNERLNMYSQCLGDDGILSFPGINKQKVIDVYTTHGLDMQPEKSSESTHEAIYLRRWYDRSYRDNQGICRGVYPSVRALGRLAKRERFVKDWSETDHVLRSLAILSQLEWHPLRERFADFVLKFDETQLGMAHRILPSLDVDQAFKEGRNSGKYEFGYVAELQSQRRPLSRTWIYLYLKEKFGF